MKYAAKKTYKYEKLSSTKLTRIQAFLKLDDETGYHNLWDKRNRKKPKFKLGELVGTTDKKNIFSEDDKTKSAYRFCAVKDFISDKTPTYFIITPSER